MKAVVWSMSSPSQLNTARFSFTDADFAVIARFASREYGLDLKIEKKGLIYARLARRIRALGMDDFKTYCAYATAGTSRSEQSELLSALTTNVTSFFREQHHFDMLRSQILPNLGSRLASGKKIRIWSAGCSGGQEPYSIAATLRESIPNLPADAVQILATDVDERILERAKAAVYRPAEVTGLSETAFNKLFTGSKDLRTSFEVRPELRRMVKFETLNLVGNWVHDVKFDIVFCRNVVIYFERATQHRLWTRFHDSMTPEGCLFIGHSERLSGPSETRFNNIGITAFEKVSP